MIKFSNRFLTVALLLFIHTAVFCQGHAPTLYDFKQGVEYRYVAGELIEGEFAVFYKLPECTMFNERDRLTKPFIIVEGLDPNSANNHYGIYKDFNDQSGRLLDSLRQEGFDIVTVDLKTNGKEIEKNAYLLELILSEINGQVLTNHNQHGTRFHRPYLAGISMGGLVARWCLSIMEEQGHDHKVESYISFDAPQKGANVPIGLMNLFDQVGAPATGIIEAQSKIPGVIRGLDPINRLNDFLSEENPAILTLAQPASAQMAMNYIRPNSKRLEFRVALQQLGYPNKVWKRIGIANGTSGKSQEDIAEGSKLFEWTNLGFCFFDTRVDLPFDLGHVDLKWCPLNHSVNAYATPGVVVPREMYEIPGTLSSVSMEVQPAPLLPGISVSDRRFMVVNMDPLNAPVNPIVDHVPGGKYDASTLFEGIASEANNSTDWSFPVDWDYTIPGVCVYPEIICHGLECDWGCHYEDIDVFHIHQDVHVFDANGRINYAPSFCFVPTVSALDINTNDWFYDIAGLGHYPHRDKTPFDDIYWAQNSNTLHASLPEGTEGRDMAAFMKEEISPFNLYIQSRTFPDGYENTFEARGIIKLGNNVDPVAGRSKNGNVVLGSGGAITLVYGNGNSAEFEDGFDASNYTGVLEVVENTNTCDNTLTPLRRLALNEDNTNASKKIKNKKVKSTYNAAEVKGVFNDEQPISPWQFSKKKPSLVNIQESLNASPNPFNVETTITYQLPQAGSVSLVLYNSLGVEVVKIIDGQTQQAGNYEYNLNGSNLANGVYLYSLTYNNVKTTKKLLLSR